MKKNNSILKLVLRATFTVIVFAFFVTGMVFHFKEKKDDHEEKNLLHDYVQRIINDEDYDDEYIGEEIVKENLKELKDYVSTFDSENIRSETNIEDLNTIDKSIIWNENGINNPILVNDKLSISNSIITNISFSDAKDKELSINHSIVSISIDNLYQLEQENITVDINNSFVYLQSDNLEDYDVDIRPIFNGHVYNSLIGNRITYKEGVDPYYFNTLERGDTIDKLSNVSFKDSYYDCNQLFNYIS